MLPTTTSCLCNNNIENPCPNCWNNRTHIAMMHFAAWRQEEELEEAVEEEQQTHVATVMDITEATPPTNKRPRQ
jgi:hypothetical protein